MSFTLEIPQWHPARLNQFVGRHWSVGAKLKKADRELVTFYAREQGCPIASAKRRISVVIVLGRGQRASDPDAYQKSLLDALVCAGLLVDDSEKWVQWSQPTFERGRTSGTKITFEDVE